MLMWKWVADDSTNRIWSQNLLVGGGVSAGFQAAQSIHLQGFHAETGLQDLKSRSVLDIPTAIGHVSVIVIWSAQEQRSRIFGTSCGDVRAGMSPTCPNQQSSAASSNQRIGRKFQAVQAQV
jgi:hypothetical protein